MALKPEILAEIHRYWFGELKSPDDMPADDKVQMWFRRSDETDDRIRDVFGRYLAPASETEWDLKALSRQQRVGLVVLLDQFPRNIFRSSPDAFAFDSKARAVARPVAAGWRDLYVVEQAFAFLPFEHSEDVADQDYAVQLCAESALAAPAAHKEMCRRTLYFATKHRDIIREFGRFPHRNLTLGRQSTPDELKFLESGRGF